MIRAALISLLFASCVHPTPPPTPGADAAINPMATCADVCAHYLALGCPAGQPTAHGVTCAVVCANSQAVAPMNLGCRLAATSCAAADKCETP